MSAGLPVHRKVGRFTYVFGAGFSSSLIVGTRSAALASSASWSAVSGLSAAGATWPVGTHTHGGRLARQAIPAGVFRYDGIHHFPLVDVLARTSAMYRWSDPSSA